MASIKHTEIPKTGAPDIFKNHGLNLSLSKMELYNGVSSENDKTSSPTKCVDQTRKKMFRITSSVTKQGGSGSGNGDVGADNDADSVDGLDESQTEDFSSEFYDSSKATDLDMDIQDCYMPLTPDDMISTTTIVVKQKPDQNSQSRFKVVKIETKEPFRRGKWVCYDFYDNGPGSIVTVEKNGSKIEESIIPSALKDNLSYIQDVNDSSSKTCVPTIVPLSPVRDDGHPVYSDVFVPIQPAPANQILNQLPGLSSDVMAPFIAQQVLMSVASVPSSSNSFHNLAQPGHKTVIQSLPHTNVFPYGQNGPPAGIFQNGAHTGLSSEGLNLPSDAGSGPSNTMATATSAGSNSNIISSQAFTIVSSLPVPCSLSQTLIGDDKVVSQGVPPVAKSDLSSPAGTSHVPQYKTEAAVISNQSNEDQKVRDVNENTQSTETLHRDGEAHSDSLKEAVETVGDMYMGLEGSDEDLDESGGSTVAIDNKIEQAMDLVKRHLMYAVREEVEILKQQIGEMMERIGQLEYENTVLRSEAKPETLSKLLQPRITQTSQTTSTQNNSLVTAANLQQTTLQAAAQSSHAQQVVHQPSQQHTTQTVLPQANQPTSS